METPWSPLFDNGMVWPDGPLFDGATVQDESAWPNYHLDTTSVEDLLMPTYYTGFDERMSTYKPNALLPQLVDTKENMMGLMLDGPHWGERPPVCPPPMAPAPTLSSPNKFVPAPPLDVPVVDGKPPAEHPLAGGKSTDAPPMPMSLQRLAPPPGLELLDVVGPPPGLEPPEGLAAAEEPNGGGGGTRRQRPRGLEFASAGGSAVKNKVLEGGLQTLPATPATTLPPSPPASLCTTELCCEPPSLPPTPGGVSVTLDDELLECVSVNPATDQNESVGHVSRVQWRIPHFQQRVKNGMGNPLVSSSFCLQDLSDLRLMVFPDADGKLVGMRGKSKTATFMKMLAAKSLRFALKLKVPVVAANTPVLKFYLSVGSTAPQGPFACDFAERAIQGCDDFAVDWLSQVEADGSLRVGMELFLNNV